MGRREKLEGPGGWVFHSPPVAPERAARGQAGQGRHPGGLVTLQDLESLDPGRVDVWGPLYLKRGFFKIIF